MRHRCPNHGGHQRAGSAPRAPSPLLSDGYLEADLAA
jgi:hypothetical protein